MSAYRLANSIYKPVVGVNIHSEQEFKAKEGRRLFNSNALLWDPLGLSFSACGESMKSNLKRIVDDIYSDTVYKSYEDFSRVLNSCTKITKTDAITYILNYILDNDGPEERSTQRRISTLGLLAEEKEDGDFVEEGSSYSDITYEILEKMFPILKKENRGEDGDFCFHKENRKSTQDANLIVFFIIFRNSDQNKVLDVIEDILYHYEGEEKEKKVNKMTKGLIKIINNFLVICGSSMVRSNSKRWSDVFNSIKEIHEKLKEDIAKGGHVKKEHNKNAPDIFDQKTLEKEIEKIESGGNIKDPWCTA